jgi:hypothetical protein
LSVFIFLQPKKLKILFIFCGQPSNDVKEVQNDKSNE